MPERVRQAFLHKLMSGLNYPAGVARDVKFVQGRNG